MVRAYHASSATLNLVRAFTQGGFADLREVHSWNKGFAQNPANQQYERLATEIDRAIKFMEAAGADFDDYRSWLERQRIEVAMRTGQPTGVPELDAIALDRLQRMSLHLEGLKVEVVESLRSFPHGKRSYILHQRDAHGDGLVHGRHIHLCLGADGIALQLVFTDIEDEPYIFYY